MRSSNNATVSARASSSTSDVALLELKFEAPAPGLIERAGKGLPRNDRVRTRPFVFGADVGVEERAGPLDGGEGASVGSVEGLRPGVVPAGGFFVAVDIVYGDSK